ncbi:sialin [Anabrus simplex]|uniref:sialin n=1 Tax=Anabrus simplex TaxID=316456 RepID=UPI0035A34EAA
MGCLERITKRRNQIPARHVLCFMLFLGFMATFLLRVNINLSIVAMVNRTGMDSGATINTKTSISSEQQENMTTNTSDDAHADKVSQGEFNWNEMQQSIILGSFFWGYLIFQIPGGRVAEVYGTKRVFGGAILLNGLLCLLLPMAARMHWYLLLIIRALQGLAQGVLFPALSACAARWIPLKERAKFLAFTCCGASMGTVASMPLCGAIIASWGWEMVFYVSGLLTVLWSAAWWVLVYESPEKHPRISEREKQYLASSLDNKTETLPVPWRKVLTCKQFWLGCSASWGNDWGFHTLITLAPKYIKEALGFDLSKSSWLSSLPFLCQYLFSTAYGILVDELVGRGMPLLMVRRVSTVISHLLPAIGLVTLASINCDQVTLSIALLTSSISFIGAYAAGFFQHPLDIAPNFAGSLTGIMNGFGAVTGVISPPIAGIILHNTDPVQGWPIIFCIAAAMYTTTSLPYLLFGRPEVQPWNDVRGEGYTMTSSAEDHGEEKQPELEKLQPA